MRKLITLAAAGMLLVAMLPATASAATGDTNCNGNGGSDCVTGVTLVVTIGTTIYAPADFTIGTGFPGQVVTSALQTVEWLSNDTGLDLAAQLSDMTCTVTSGTCVNAGTNQLIDNEDFGLIVGAGSENAFGSTPLFVHALAVTGAEKTDLADGDAADSQDFNIVAHVPSVHDGDYTGTLTFSVQ